MSIIEWIVCIGSFFSFVYWVIYSDETYKHGGDYKTALIFGLLMALISAASMILIAVYNAA